MSTVPPADSSGNGGADQQTIDAMNRLETIINQQANNEYFVTGKKAQFDTKLEISKIRAGG
jgi:hypothetical protein